jgi:peptidoglycan/xylan/chitin deacetylase (PgdA/CDA1 family)
MDVECPGAGTRDAGFRDWDLGENSVRGFVERLGREGWPTTLLVVPAAAARYRRVLRDLAGSGTELGLHIHPQDLGYEEHLGTYSGEEQIEILRAAMKQWEDAIAGRPCSFRPGNFSANDATFPALEALGFRQGSVSSPERKMTSLSAVWTGAPKDAHWAHRANRLLAGNSTFLEVPVTVDWETMIWGGQTALELRIETVDGRAHGYTVRKNIRRMLADQVTPMALVAITHNFFDYTSSTEFRSITLGEIIQGMKEAAEENGVELRGVTLEEFRKVYVSETGSAASAAV